MSTDDHLLKMFQEAANARLGIKGECKRGVGIMTLTTCNKKRDHLFDGLLKDF
jgi:hypothetical protein